MDMEAYVTQDTTCLEQEMVKFVEQSEVNVYCTECNDTKLIVRTNKKTGHQFLGCPQWPQCSYTREIPDELILRALGQKELF